MDIGLLTTEERAELSWLRTENLGLRRERQFSGWWKHPLRRSRCLRQVLPDRTARWPSLGGLAVQEATEPMSELASSMSTILPGWC